MSYRNNVYSPSAPSYYGEIHFEIDKPYPVFWPGNTISGRVEPDFDMRLALTLTATYHNGKTKFTQGPVVISDTVVQAGQCYFNVIIPDIYAGRHIPMSFRDEQANVEYRVVGFDLVSSEQLRGHVVIQIMIPIMINSHTHRVLNIDKRLKIMGIPVGDLKLGVRVNNPELRPGDDLSLKLVYDGHSARKLERATIKIVRRVTYNIGKEPTTRIAPQNDHIVVRAYYTFGSIICDREVRLPLSISLPHLLPSSGKHTSFGNYVRVSYIAQLKLVTGKFTNQWDIPIHVGTTNNPPVDTVYDMEYAALTKPPKVTDDNEQLFGLIFNSVRSPWPSDDNSETGAVNLAKIYPPVISEEKSLTLLPMTGRGEAQTGGGGVHSLPTEVESPTSHSLTGIPAYEPIRTCQSLTKHSVVI